MRCSCWWRLAHVAQAGHGGNFAGYGGRCARPLWQRLILWGTIAGLTTVCWIDGPSLADPGAAATPISPPSATLATVVAATPHALTAQHQPILNALRAADIVYLGEVHNNAGDRAGQLAILQALHVEQPNLAIALECFQRPFQGAIDAYLAGEISEAQLVEQSEYATRWGFPWESYAPLLRFAKANQIPVIAANAPTEATRQVARAGLQSLSGDLAGQVPAIADIDLGPDPYREMLREVFAAHAHGGHGNSAGFENFFAAQVLWDETMAEAIAQFRQTHPETQIVAIAGRGHISHHYGIPDRVARRFPQAPPQQASVFFIAADQTPPPASTPPSPVVDFWWVYPANAGQRVSSTVSCGQEHSCHDRTAIAPIPFKRWL